MKAKIKPSHAGVITMKDGTRKNYGVIEISKDGRHLVYYTGKGLRKLFSKNLSKEEQEEAEKLKTLDRKSLRRMGYVGVTPLDEIEELS